MSVLGAISGLNGVLATALLCALLYVDEAGLPLPLAPNEVLLLFGGLLVGTGALEPVVFLPLALIAMVAGMLTGFGWARAIGSTRLHSLARRVHAEATYEKAAERLRRAGPIKIGLTRLLPGVRTYATLVAGAAGVQPRRFLLGAAPALVLWLVALVTIGAVAGVPAERVVGKVDGFIVTGALLVLLGLGAFVSVSRVPRAPRDGNPFGRLPEAARLTLAIAIDLGILAASIAGIERLVARVVNPGHPFGRLNDALLVVTVGLVAYVVAARRIGGATLGESLSGGDYRDLAQSVVTHWRRRRTRSRGSSRSSRSAS